MPKRRQRQPPAPESKKAQRLNGSPEEDEEPQNDSPTSSDSAVTSGSDSSGDGDAGAGDGDTSMSEEVEVDIEFFDPKEADFHGVRTLVQNLLGGAEFDASQLADAIITQESVGTVVKSGEDEEPIGVASALSLRRYGSLEALKQIKAHLLQHCEDAAAKQQLQEALLDPGTGLLVNERVLNCPPQISPPLMSALFDEIERAVDDEPTKELQDSFRFTQHLLVAPVYRDVTAARPDIDQAAKPARQKAKAKVAPALMYTKPEDEFFHRRAAWSFTFDTPAKGGATDDLQPMRLVMAVTPQQAADARKELDEVIGNDALAQAQQEA